MEPGVLSCGVLPDTIEFVWMFSLWKNVQNPLCENVSICLNSPFPQAIFYVKILPMHCGMGHIVKAPQTVAQVVLLLQHLIYRYEIIKNNSNTSYQIVYPLCLS